MAHYINKDALVAEIERRIESCAKQREDMLNVQCHTLADDASARMGELNCIQDFLDTLEVKEVDLNNEYIEEIYSHLDGIKETSDRMTSGNFMHNRAAIKFSANTIAKVLELIGIKAQKG